MKKSIKATGAKALDKAGKGVGKNGAKKIKAGKKERRR